MRKNILKKVIAFVLALTMVTTVSYATPASAAQSVPTRYVYVGDDVSSSAYQLAEGAYTYSPRNYTPARNEYIGITIYSSYDQHISVSVYSDVTGFVTSLNLYLDDGDDYTIYTAVGTSVYFLFNNLGDDYAIAQYSVFSY